MEYYTTSEIALKWNLSRRRVSKLCAEGRLSGAIQKGNTWLIPEDAQKPLDGRKKEGKVNGDN